MLRLSPRLHNLPHIFATGVNESGVHFPREFHNTQPVGLKELLLGTGILETKKPAWTTTVEPLSDSIDSPDVRFGVVKGV